MTISMAKNNDQKDLNALQVFQPDISNYVHPAKSWKPIESGNYQAGPYSIPFQRRGVKGALPLMDLPGGPASPLSSRYKECFARNMFDVTLAEWRGAGSSTPLGGIAENTKDHLIEDIEKLRQQSEYDQVMLCGGSWGATIALEYAAIFPQQVSGLVLRLPFLAREEDVKWNFSEDGAARKNPQAYDRFISRSGEKTAEEAVVYYANQLNDPDATVYKQAFIEWKAWEWAKCGEVLEDTVDDLDIENPRFATDLGRARIMAHYTQNNFFFGKEGLVPALRSVNENIPIIVVTNEHDALCSPDALTVMRNNMPNAEFVINKGADWHWIFDPKSSTPGRNNQFIEQSYAYAAEKMRRILAGDNLTLNTEKPHVL